jgi:hypothetical protein
VLLRPYLNATALSFLSSVLYSLRNPALQTHMLAALSAFDASTSPSQTGSAVNAAQSESDKSDAIAAKLREKEAAVQKPRDALFLAVHALLLEAGADAKCCEFSRRRKC